MAEPSPLLIKEIETLCRTELSVRVRSTDQDLFESGVLDSLLLVQLLLELERHFHLELPLAELDLASIRSIEEMARMIGARLDATSAGSHSRVANQLAG